MEEHEYQSQWSTYRERRKRIMALVIAEFIAFLPFVALIATVEQRFLRYA